MSRQVETTFYAVVKPKFGRRWDSSVSRQVDCVDSIRVTGITQKRPAKPDGVVCKLTLRFNEVAFMPLQPQAVIEIPDSLIAVQQDIEVEAEDPNDAAVAAALASRFNP